MERNRSNANIFSKAETEIVLDRALLRDALKAGWISACAYRPRKTRPAAKLFSIEDNEAVEECVRAGEYPPTQRDLANQTRKPICQHFFDLLHR